MTSAGGLLPVADAADLPAALLLSGPAGGVRAAAAVAVANGFPDAITFDMGGTSTDVCLVLDGAPAPAAERSVGGYTVRFPALDIHTIGAGGGSIAHARPRRRAAGRAAAARAPTRARPATGAAAPSPRSPTPTWSPVASPRTPRSAGWRSTATRPSGRWRGRGDRRRRDPGRRRVHGAGAARGVGGARRRPARRWRSSRSAAPARCTPARWPTRSSMPAVIVPARAGVLSAVGLLTVAAPARPRALVAHPARPHRAGRRSTPAGGRGGQARRPRRRRPPPPSTAATPARATSSPSRRPPRSTRPTSSATASPAPTRRSRWSPSAPRPSLPSGFDLTDLPAPPRSPARGPAAIAEPDCTIWLPDGWSAEPGAAGALVLRRTDRDASTPRRCRC